MLAYFNEELIPYQDVRIPAWDYGFTMGVAVTEQLRTFNGQLHCLDQHLNRLWRGLSITGIEPGLSRADVRAISLDVAKRNFEQIPAGQDLNLGICITPGAQLNRVPVDADLRRQATVLIHAETLPFDSWARHYKTGIALSTVSIQEVPVACIPAELKCRSRMHYFLAEQEAEQTQSGSRALLLDALGFVAEATTASVVMVKGNQLIAPPRDAVLPGITWGFVEEQLAPRAGLEPVRRRFDVSEIQQADEALWLSTSPGVLPVAAINGRQIGNSNRRIVFNKLIETWSELTGVNIVRQAMRGG